MIKPHPFGMLMSERSYSSPVYRYGFNGQEKDDEVAGSGNTNTAEYWEYDTRLGRRWNLDPYPQICISDYGCFANSPIFYKDINGDKWDPDNGSTKSAEDFKIDTETKIKSINTSIAKINDKITNLDVKSITYKEDKEKYEGQKKDATDKMNELSDAITELVVLEKSPQMYSLRPQVLDPTNPTEAGGMTYEMRGGEGVVVLNYLVGDISSKAHELKHGYQYEKGQTSIRKNGGGRIAGQLHDLTDERAAYRRQSAFDNSRPKLSNLTDDEIKNISYKAYGALPSEALDKSMLISDILLAHLPPGPGGASYPNKYLDKKFEAYEEDYFIK